MLWLVLFNTENPSVLAGGPVSPRFPPVGLTEWGAVSPLPIQLGLLVTSMLSQTSQTLPQHSPHGGILRHFLSGHICSV